MLNTEQLPNPRHFQHLRVLPELIVGHARKVNHQSSLIICSPDVCTFIPFNLHQHIGERKSRRRATCVSGLHICLSRTLSSSKNILVSLGMLQITPEGSVWVAGAHAGCSSHSWDPGPLALSAFYSPGPASWETPFLWHPRVLEEPTAPTDVSLPLCHGLFWAKVIPKNALSAFSSY